MECVHEGYGPRGAGEGAAAESGARLRAQGQGSSRLSDSRPPVRLSSHLPPPPCPPAFPPLGELSEGTT